MDVAYTDFAAEAPDLFQHLLLEFTQSETSNLPRGSKSTK
jgi:hypothetical protein